MTRKSTVVMILFAVICPGAAFAAGTTAAQVFEIEPSARAAGMGGAFTAVADDAFSMFYNPAGLALVRGCEIPFASNQRLGGVNQGFGGVAYNMRDIRTSNIDELGTVAFSYTNFDSGHIDGRDALGQPSGSFSVTDGVMAFAYGRSLFDNADAGRFSLGLNGKFLEEKIAGSKFSGQAFDAGGLWENAARTFSFGASVMNMGQPMDFDREEFSLPLTVKVGVAFRMPDENALVAFDYNDPTEGEAGFALGGEYWLKRTVALRIGYDGRSDIAAGLTAGFGFSMKDVNAYFMYARDLELDYAFIQSNDVDSMHLLSLVLKLGAD